MHPQLTTFNNLSHLKDTFRKLAALNVIFCPEVAYRYHRYHPKWAEEIDLGIIDNGSGDTLFAVFHPKGCVLKGFDHESSVSPYAQPSFEIWEGMYDGLPDYLARILDDKALINNEVTFCYWKTDNDATWQQGPVHFPNQEEDGSDYLMPKIYATAEDFIAWAGNYFGQDYPLPLVQHIFDGKPITDALLLGLNPNLDLASAKTELQELGFL